MVRITEEMIRKRAEHNEGEICTLEELSLHQQDIEKIEHLDKWCRDLKILYLQSNLIGRIENVGRLKNLEYLNLALNNIERVENLEGCESLKKLDLTVNFIGDILSLQSLKDLHNLREIYLTGNPCSQYQNYRDFVICVLPQLQMLDGEEISRSDRITAQQNFRFIHDKISQEQQSWMQQRQMERDQATERRNRLEQMKQQGHDVEEQIMQEKVPYTPESRMETHEFMQEKRRRENPEQEKPAQKPRELFFADGRPYNVNEAKVDFSLTDDEEQDLFVLDVAVFRHMDTSLIDCDVQPQYVRVTIKSKILQLALPAEVRTDESTARRSATTGHLVITMPKVQSSLAVSKTQPSVAVSKTQLNQAPAVDEVPKQRQEFLEVDPSCKQSVSISDIAASPTNGISVLSRSRPPAAERPNSEDFVDDPDVPPLM